MTSVQNILSELILSPEGCVYLMTGEQAREQLPISDFEKINSFFSENPSSGLLHLGIQEFTSLPSSFSFWQTFSRSFITQICKLVPAQDPVEMPSIPPPQKENLQEFLDRAPFIKGFEYLNLDLLKTIWHGLADAFLEKLRNFSGNVQEFLNEYNPRWNLVGRVCFHLAENKKDEERPFAFLATYTTQLSLKAAPQHLPLKRALLDYSEEKNQAALLALLLPVQKAASQSACIKELVDSGAIFQAQAWTAREAHRFLKEIPLMESSGVMVRIPNWWNAQKPPRAKVSIQIGDRQSAGLGLAALLDFDLHVVLGNGEKLSQKEWEALLNSEDKFIKIKEQWVEVDGAKLKAVLTHWKQLQQGASQGLSMAEGLRLLAGGNHEGIASSEDGESEAVAEWSAMVPGDWLKTVLDQLRDPQSSFEQSLESILQQHLHGSLRPYQLKGVQWLWLLYQLKLGGCLADDMGLGKTIQVLSLLLIVKYWALKRPHLLVVPASLLGNWQAEAARFAPSLKILIAHSSANCRTVTPEQLAEIDLVITTYAFVSRLEELKNVAWDLLILDEAQLVKNPDAKQTRTVKTLKSAVRFTLTGTPIENRLGDLWSLFDFTSPGLLGSSKTFTAYAKSGAKNHLNFIATLRNLTQPYILRRLKSDKKIITDLPDKTEMLSYCSLSKEQVQLYQQAIRELAERLEEAEGIQRRGIILAYLTRLKQICNHPVQWLGYGEYTKTSSGKFIRLQEICEEIAAKQEKVLVFTQFKEIIPALSSFLAQVFSRQGLALDGDTAIKKRAELVASFQQELGPPFFVLSLKAGGTGLNLTSASHVIHFDRWWNPAVENQATDRAYRIGQKHPVLVHKFICRGTIEEKIEELSASKKKLSQEILEGGGEQLLTEMDNEALLDLISIDIKRALGDP